MGTDNLLGPKHIMGIFRSMSYMPTWWRVGTPMWLHYALLLNTLIGCGWPMPVLGQGIAFDNATPASGSSSTDDERWDHTIGSGSARLLIVGVAYRMLSSSSPEVDRVRYNSDELTRVGIVSNGDHVSCEIWQLVAPSTGTNEVRVELTDNTQVIAGAASFFNVDQTTPVGTFFSATGLSNTPSLMVTSVAEGELVIDALALKNNASATADTGQTERWDANQSSNLRSASSTEPGPDGGGSGS